MLYNGLAMDFQLAERQIRMVHFDITYPLVKGDIDALNNKQAFLYLYGKGEYWAENDPGNKRPLPFCLIYNGDVPGALAVCPKSIKIVEGHPGNITHPNKEGSRKESAILIFSTKAEVVRFDGHLLEFMLKVSNDSEAVARNVIVQHAFSLGPAAPIDFTHGSPNGPFTISPHKEVPVAFRQIIEPYEMTRIQNEKGSYLFFYGSVRPEEGEAFPFCFVYLKDFKNFGDCASLNSPGTRKENEN